MTTDYTTTLATQTHQSSRANLKKRIPSSGRLSKLATLTSTKTTPSKPTHRRTHSTQSGRTITDDEDEDVVSEDEDATFLPYCAYCEKQIDTPGRTLYCSDHCQKQDLRSSKCYELFSHDTPSPLTPSKPSIASAPIKDIMPQFSPTIAPSPFERSRAGSATDFFDFEIGQDGTTGCRPDPDAAAYLAQFRPGYIPSARPPLNKSHTAHDADLTLPSLSSTATTASLSASRPFTPYNYQTRRDRWGGSVSSRSVDLVTPVQYHQSSDTASSLVTITEKTAGMNIGRYSESVPSAAFDSDSLSYEKKRTVPGSAEHLTPGKSSLKQLFGARTPTAPGSGAAARRGRGGA